MLRWSAEELTEWLLAFHAFRRTRSYGALYKLERPPIEDVGPIAWLGKVLWQAGRYVHRLVLLDSIPEDNLYLATGPPDRRTSWQRFKRRLALDQVSTPPPIPMRLGDIEAAIEHHPLIIGTMPRS